MCECACNVCACMAGEEGRERERDSPLFLQSVSLVWSSLRL